MLKSGVIIIIIIIIIDTSFDRPDPAHAVSQSVSLNQEIHNYYEEISTHIKYKLTEYKGLTAAWQQHQDADSAVAQATSALTHAEEEVCIMHPMTILTRWAWKRDWVMCDCLSLVKHAA